MVHISVTSIICDNYSEINIIILSCCYLLVHLFSENLLEGDQKAVATHPRTIVK